MPQFGRPISDIATTQTWYDQGAGTTNIYLSIDEESASDADYIYSSNNGTGYYECGLTSLTDPQSSSDHIIRWRLRATNTRTLTVVTYLFQGTTLITSASTVNPGTGFTTGSLLLSGAEADSITDYTNLRFRFDVTVNGGAGQETEISWAELEIPSAAGVTVDGQVVISSSANQLPSATNIAIDQVEMNGISILDALATNLNISLVLLLGEGNIDAIASVASIVSGITSISGVASLELLNLLLNQGQTSLSGISSLEALANQINLASTSLDGQLTTDLIGAILLKMLVSWAEFQVPQAQAGLVTGAVSMNGVLAVLTSSLLSILSNTTVTGNLSDTLNALNIIQSLIQIANTSDIISYPLVQVINSVSITALGTLIASGTLEAFIESSVSLNGQAALIGNALQIIEGTTILSGIGALELISLISILSTMILDGRGNIGVISLILNQALAILLGTGDFETNQIVTKTTDTILLGTGDISLNSTIFINALSQLSGFGDLLPVAQNTIQSSLTMGGILSLIASGTTEAFIAAQVILSGLGDIDSTQALNIIQSLVEIGGIGTIIAVALLQGIVSAQTSLLGESAMSLATQSILYALVGIVNIGDIFPTAVFEGFVEASTILSGLTNIISENTLLNISANVELVNQVALLTQSAVATFAQAIIDGNQEYQILGLNLLQSTSELIGRMGVELFGQHYVVSSATIYNELLMLATTVSYIYAVSEMGGLFEYDFTPIVVMPTSTILGAELAIDATGVATAIGSAQVTASAEGNLLSTALLIANGQAILDASGVAEAQALITVLVDAILSGVVSPQLTANLLIETLTVLSGLGVLIPVGEIPTSFDSFVPLERTFAILSEDRIYFIDKNGRIFIINSEDREYWINKYRR